ncbi:MAG: hypothetical protein ACI4EF_12565 [Coprococcus sp.]
MTEPIHSLNKQMTDRFLYNRYNKFNEERIPTEYVKPNTNHTGINIPDTESLFKRFVEEVIGIAYMEPDNPYHYHTLYASARGINSNEIIFEIVYKRIRRFLFFDIANNELILLCKEECDKEGTAAYIHIVCNRGKIGRKYGDFGFILSLLDAGHFLEVIKCFFEEENLKLTADYNGYKKDDLARLNQPYQLYPILKVDISGIFGNIDNLFSEGDEICNLMFSEKYTGNSEGSLIDRFIKRILNSHTSIIEKKSDVKGFDTQVRVEDLYRRTSSQSAQGYSFFPYNCSQETIDVIINCTKRMLDNMDNNFICVQLVINDMSGRVYDIKKDSVDMKIVETLEINSIPNDSLDFVDLKNVSIVVILYTNCSLYHEEEVQYQFTYVKMGEIAQRISDICGLYDLSARPMKNMNDRYIREILMDDEYDSGYLITIGKSMNDSLKMILY